MPACLLAAGRYKGLQGKRWLVIACENKVGWAGLGWAGLGWAGLGGHSPHQLQGATSGCCSSAPVPWQYSGAATALSKGSGQ